LAALACCLLTCGCTKPADPIVVVVEKPATPAFDPAAAFPRVDAPRPPVSSQPEPFAVQAREEVIRRDADVIAAQCVRAAGGDWERWQRDTADYRAALKSKVEVLKTFDPPRATYDEANTEPLEGRDKFPLFEVGPRASLRFLYQPEVLDTFRRDRPVVAVHRWLRARGIDLIFVPAPKLTEVYMEHFLDPCPPDGIIAPHVRRTLHELLDEGVEVVDGLPLFRALRDADPEFLYNTADPHWGPRAMRIMAKEVADRIARYKFGASARYGLPIVKTSTDRFMVGGRTGPDMVDTAAFQMGWLALTEQQRARARPVQSSCCGHVTTQDGREVPDDPRSPVAIVGNSFVLHFREQLVKESNLLVRGFWRPGTTTEMMAEFLREPDMLKDCKVVVWVVSDRHFQDFKPLPAPIMAVLRENDPRSDTRPARKTTGAGE
jgi:hypothetical protein